MKPFTGNFTLQKALSDAAIAGALEVLKSGRLHRYNSTAGEVSAASRFEAAYAGYQNAKYCLACASGGYAMNIALRCAGVRYNEPVLTNAFTSNHHSWRYFADQQLPQTDQILSGLFDLRLPLTFSLDDCRQIAAIIAHCHKQILPAEAL